MLQRIDRSYVFQFFYRKIFIEQGTQTLKSSALVVIEILFIPRKRKV